MTTRCCSPCAYGGVPVRPDLAVRPRQPRRRASAALGRPAARSARRSASASWSRRRSPTALLQGGLWALALVLDMGGPYVYDSSGWKLVPGHFAERHGLIVLIALGESIVAIGAGAEVGIDAGVVVAAVLGHGGRGGAVLAVLRRRRAGGGAPAVERRTGTRAQRDRARLLLVPALPDGGRHRAGGSRRRGDAGRTWTRTCTSCRRSRCSAAPRCTWSPTSPSGGATSTGSAPAADRRGRVRRADPGRRARCRRWPTLALLAAVLVALIVDERRRFAELRDRLRRQLAEA